MAARRGLGVVTATGALLVVGSLALPASPGVAATAPGFGAPVELPGQLGTGGDFTGGEPSLSVDTANGSVFAYVSAPQSVPAVAGQVLNGNTCGDGIGFWRSADGGASFGNGQCVGSGLGGGDDSSTVTPDHSVYLADLEAAAAAICKSTDFGLSFSSGNGAGGCTGLVSDQTGPEDDRPWVTGGPQNQVYFTYHDFAFGLPLIERSGDGGKTFLPCGTILQPGSAAMANYNPLGGTLVSDPAIDKAGNLYVEVSEPTNTAVALQSTITSLYMAVGHGGCDNGTAFQDSTIYSNSTANLGNIFDATAVDGGGTVYVVAAGKTSSADKTFDIWLFTSHDGGSTWSAPVKVNSSGLTANVMPAVVGGASNGQVAVGWFGTSTSDSPDTTTDVWNYFVATSTAGGAPGSFTQAQVSPTPLHYGDICTEGTFCGLLPGSPSNRNLLDFDSLAVNPLTGCLIAAIPGDPYNTFAAQSAGTATSSSSVYVARQTSGCFPLAVGTAAASKTVVRTTKKSPANRRR